MSLLIMLPIFLFIIFSFLSYTKKIITKYGFNVMSVFILTFILFYLVVPLVHLYFKDYRDKIALFTIMLNTLQDEQIIINFFICSMLLLLIIFVYNTSFRKVEVITPSKEEFKILNTSNYTLLLLLTHGLFLICGFSLLLLIIETGSIGNYLALGSQTRGLDTNVTNSISSSYLQLVTLTTMTLATPFLYFYLYKIKKNKLILLLFVISLLLAIFFLLYNQGRAPLILYFLPFLFIYFNRKRNSKALIKLSLIFIIGLLLLEYLDDLFNYISYGVASNEVNESIITTFHREFSYPFSNFTLRHDISELMDFRYFFDFIIWPFTMIPDSILNIIGLTKSGLVSISLENTDVYSNLVGVAATGGIPVDFLTLNYFQLGYISLIFNCIIAGFLIKKLDLIFLFFKNNIAIKLILLRISFSMINILNNADPSAIVRNRLDIVFLLIIVIIIYYVQRRKYHNTFMRSV